eukprot:Pgem_evm1s12665
MPLLSRKKQHEQNNDNTNNNNNINNINKDNSNNDNRNWNEIIYANEQNVFTIVSVLANVCININEKRLQQPSPSPSPSLVRWPNSNLLDIIVSNNDDFLFSKFKADENDLFTFENYKTSN